MKTIINPTKTERWIAAELTFESDTRYETESFFFDVSFKNRETGTTLLVPGFWDGGNVFRVRFTPTECGIWDYTTKCDGDASLSGKTGTVEAVPYAGDLAIYQHGFIKAVPGTKYFMYADGTPFFYLGDTHWGMLREEFDSLGRVGEDAGVKAASHFKHIVDRRVEQGFTVYQSEPIDLGTDLKDGVVKESDIEGFRAADKYFAYIASKGLVHANAQFFFQSAIPDSFIEDATRAEAISHHWVARFGSYPVMWTLGQEIDNNGSKPDETGMTTKRYSWTNNPWVGIAELLHRFDAYGQPLSGHQVHAIFTTASGKGVTRSKSGRSAFFADDVTKATGHNWYASQWKLNWNYKLTEQVNDIAVKDYWESPKVCVNYEGSYEYLVTKNFGAVAQAWISYLSGFHGYGYGAQDIWLYNSAYGVENDSDDGIEPLSSAEKKAMKWPEALELPSAAQLGYLRAFFESFDWWNLVPDFNDQKVFKPANDAFYVCAAKGNETVVVYFYSLTNATGTVLGLDGTYSAQWFNPRTNEYTSIGDITADPSGWSVPERPAAQDYVLFLKRV